MPQINRGFSLSKMNKDFDERIVKEGEYRDALNIQVQASEGSDVGSAQSVLGNVLLSSGMVPEGSRCVGAVTYDKEDKIYYLVAGPQYADEITEGTWKDYIIEYDVKTQSFKYVFVDIYRTHFVTSATSSSRYLPVDSPTNPPISHARFEMTVNGYDTSGLQIIFSNDTETTSITDADDILVGWNYEPQIQVYSHLTDYNTTPVPVGTLLQCTQRRVLNFLPNNLITGINIIDGMLFWTDNHSEPKKINIERSISGTGGTIELPLVVGTVFTGDNADWHTRLCITPDKHHGLRVLRRTVAKTHYAEEENITVIKKGPRTPPRLVMSKHEDGRFDGSGNPADTFSPTAAGIEGNPDNAVISGLDNCLFKLDVTPTDVFRVPKVVGDTIGDIILDNPVYWKEGDVILFNQQQDINSAEGFTEHDVRATIKLPLPSPIPSVGPWYMDIQSIDGDDIDEEQKMWNLRLEEVKPMFEFKFVRFAYRYKYEDGEYSTFSPWSEPAFLPGEYDYLPKKGYNLGMTNRLRQLKITNYITELSERPKDVIEVDLLYKDEVSPNIYTVETIKRTDGWSPSGNGELLWPDTINGPAINATWASRGEYNVTSELIHKAVPSNQMLRPWDNVPRKALAQSISANRLVYGNYVQNFNLTSDCVDDFDLEIKPNINVSLRAIDAPLNAPPGTDNAPLNGDDNTTGFAHPGKTARSLRTYQVGVVYGDEYGRETPVLAGHNGTGSLTILKDNSSTLNKLSVDISTPAPDFAYYYKLYVKETSNEYYNLAMDRWYNAEDGNIWLSFASADRNKVDIETSLVLKKKHDSHIPVTDPARYKILAIENSAPDFIKTNIKSLGILNNNAGGTDIGTTSNGFPAPDADKLWFNTGMTGLSDIFGNSDAYAQLLGMRNRGTLYFRVRTDTIKSDWYQVAGYTTDGTRHKFKSDKPFQDDMDFTSIGGDISAVISGLKIELAEFTVENKKEFEGRFFVKIYKDLVLQNEILSTIQPEYRVKMAQPMGYWNIPQIETPNALGPGPAGWESCGTNMKQEFDANTNGADQWCAPDYTTPGDEELFFKGANNSWIQGTTFAWGCVLNPPGSVMQNVSDWCSASVGRFHIDNMYVRADRNWNCSGSCCIGVRGDNSENMGRGIHDGSGNPDKDGLSMDIGYITTQDINATPYTWGSQAAEDFYDLLRSPGTKFRWREDPDEIVYTVTSSIPCSASGSSSHGQMHTWHKTTAGKSGNNKFRFQINFERTDMPGMGFGSGLAGYHPIGGKDVTKVPNRPELGYWGGQQSDTSTALKVVGAGDGKFNQFEIPLPLGYPNQGADPSFTANQIGSTSLTSIETVGNLGVTPLTVTKQEQGCRYRQHASKFHHIEIVEPLEDDDADWSSENPAIWETEPKEDVGVDIYYEASPALPIVLNAKTNEMYAPYGSIVVDQNGNHNSVNYPDQNYVISWSGNSVQFTHPIDVGTTTGTRIGFKRPDGLVTYGIVEEGVDPVACIANPGPGPGTYFCSPSNYYTIHDIRYCPHPTNNWYSDNLHNQPVDLSWYNAFAFGNGIESDRMRDDYNQVTIANGVKASSVIATQYEEERRKTGLIHSGLYNSTSGINDLNQFIAAEKITKDMNPEYGSIQKLHTRDGDIVVMHEDKIMKVLADKNALYNADGSSNVALAEKFLGSDRPFATKYGISTNPESFAADPHGRIYFTDRARSAVLRLSGDGITNISDYGMKDWFNDHLNSHTGIAIGSYDAKKRLYNISIEGFIPPPISDESTDESIEIADGEGSGGCGCTDPNANNDQYNYEDFDPISGDDPPNLPNFTFFQKTISFSEKAKGWVSFKSFFPEWGLSLNNEYYTWNKGDMYQHHANDTRNYFYGVQYKSTINILFNDSPEVVKSFTALNYEGSLARITPHVQPVTPIGPLGDGEYYNLTGKDGWYVDQSTTDLQTTGQLEFKDKEGKYFSYIKGTSTTLQNLDEQEFSVQGIGVLGPTDWDDEPDPEDPIDPEDLLDWCLEIEPVADCTTVPPVLGCTDPAANNYDASATMDDGSCTYDIIGCRDPNAYNYDSSANISCDDDNPADTNGNLVNGSYTLGCICGQDGPGCCCCFVNGCMDDSYGGNPDINGDCNCDYIACNVDVNGDPIPFNVGYPNPGGCEAVYGPNSGYLADNYNPDACCDDPANPCTYPCALAIHDYQITGETNGSDGEFWIQFGDGSMSSFHYTLFNSSGIEVITSWGLAQCTVVYPSPPGPLPCYDFYWNSAQSQWGLAVVGLPDDTYTLTMTDNDTDCSFTFEVVIDPPPIQFQCFSAGGTGIELHDASPGGEDWATNYGIVNGDEARLMASHPAFGLALVNCFSGDGVDGYYVLDISGTNHYTNVWFKFKLEIGGVQYPTNWLEALNNSPDGYIGGTQQASGGVNFTDNNAVYADCSGNSVPYSTWDDWNSDPTQDWESDLFGSWGDLLDFLNSLVDNSGTPIFLPAFSIATDSIIEVEARMYHDLGWSPDLTCTGGGVSGGVGSQILSLDPKC